MVDVILEIGTEEIPANCIENTLKDLKHLTAKNLKELKINYENINVFGTPRRLILFISQLNKKQEDVSLKVKGPAVAIAFDKEMNPQKPALKFAQSQGVKVEELISEGTNKGKYIFAIKSIKGKSSIKLLEQYFPKIIKSLNFPKSMRWGTGELKFIRPIRWILAMYGEETICFDLDGLSSDNVTFGHKLLAPDKISISSSKEYFTEMKRNYVIIDQLERKERIKEEILQIIKENNGQEIVNEKQLNEINYLVEYPHAILGHFDRKYLELPMHVLVTVMEVHQKYFPIYKNVDELINAFIVVINNSNHNDNDIIKGNENVLTARLEDAKFFYREDQEIPLEKRVDELKKVVFRENMGNLLDKTKRIIALSEYIAGCLLVDEDSKKIISRSAYLCKADLVTEMVKEFPKLQGIMGKEYALFFDEKKEVAKTIFEHYLPRFSDDILPKTKSGMVLGIADKVDNIVGCFTIGLTPSGSQDPYGLRRQAMGIIRIILENNLEISLKEIIKKSLSYYKENISVEIKKEDEKIVSQILFFLQQRLKNLLLEKGMYYDVINAVLAAEINGDFNDIQLRIQVIQELYNTVIFKKIIKSSSRVMNLSKGSEETEIDELLLKKKEEISLWEHYKKYKVEIKKCIENKEYNKVFKLLEKLCIFIDEFFEQVLVMDNDKDIRKNRVGLIKKLSILFNHTAILSKISLIKEEQYG
ncbi:MAG: glycine--tRNA ligase subunit beta [Candidatus Caldatribacteriota bacterium]|nr:glycine--tRNA ligase subunit beta [Candidatus Caldatribacteriota bacterium]